ncbi:MAG: hypothetical protein ABID40_00025 [Candidatus Bipolaricaulota bacterium]
MRTQGKLNELECLTGRPCTRDDTIHAVNCWNAIEVIGGNPATVGEMVEVLKNLLLRIDDITTDEFSRGGERTEREAARALLARIKGGA